MADFITITSNGNQILARVSQIQPRLGGSLRRAVAIAVGQLQNYIRFQKLSGQVLHVRTGNLRNAVIAQEPTSDAFPIIGSVGVDRSAPYGQMQEFGTRPHVIEASRKKALRFVSGGQVVFARSVNHPGFPPHPFMAPSFRENREAIIARLRGAVSESLKE